MSFLASDGVCTLYIYNIFFLPYSPNDCPLPARVGPSHFSPSNFLLHLCCFLSMKLNRNGCQGILICSGKAYNFQTVHSYMSKSSKNPFVPQKDCCVLFSILKPELKVTQCQELFYTERLKLQNFTKATNSLI